METTAEEESNKLEGDVVIMVEVGDGSTLGGILAEDEVDRSKEVDRSEEEEISREEVSTIETDGVMKGVEVSTTGVDVIIGVGATTGVEDSTIELEDSIKVVEVSTGN